MYIIVIYHTVFRA